MEIWEIATALGVGREDVPSGPADRRFANIPPPDLSGESLRNIGPAQKLG